MATTKERMTLEVIQKRKEEVKAELKKEFTSMQGSIKTTIPNIIEDNLSISNLYSISNLWKLVGSSKNLIEGVMFGMKIIKLLRRIF